MTSLETARSRALHERMSRTLPAGDTRSATFYEPYPLSFTRGSGYRIWDVDGNEFVDLLNNFTSLVHGHAAPPIVAAITAQAQLGTTFAAPHELQAELAERISARVRSVETLRFTNSGSEAVMLALRTARAFTGRDLIVKADGGYHGSWEQVPMSTRGGYGETLGTPRAVQELVHTIDYNDADQLEALMGRIGGRVAAIILEPVMIGGGVISATPEFFQAARMLADRHGALLVADEVVTLRLHFHGYQGALGADADLTALGKIIGGGLPVGAVGGRRDVLDLLNPRRPGHVHHSGTFNGNPLTMAAGCACLDLLTAAEIERINGLGSLLAESLRAAAAGIDDVAVTRAGSLLQLHFEVPGGVSGWKDVNLGSPVLAAFHRAALERGVFIAPRGLMAVSTAMDEGVVEGAAAALAGALAAVESGRRVPTAQTS